MRNFEDRKAEIFRRSEERIALLKCRQKKIILCLLPCFVCLCIAVIITIPNAISSNKSNSLQDTASEIYNISDSTSAGNKKSSTTDKSSANKENITDSVDTEDNSTQSSNKSSTSSKAIAIVEKNNVWIYYATENGIEKEQVYLPYTTKYVFNAWKEKNGIGEEVNLISFKTDSNSTTSVSEYAGSEIVTHTIGDYFILNLTVSKNIEEYYSLTDKDSLLESLKKTMTEYNGTQYDEYNLILE